MSSWPKQSYILSSGGSVKEFIKLLEEVKQFEASHIESEEEEKEFELPAQQSGAD